MSEIDVSKCSNFNIKSGKCRIHHFETNIRFTNCKCEDIKTCYYKQLQQIKDELHQKVEFIHEQRDIIDAQSKEIEMYKKCQGSRASKREEQLKQENYKLKQQLQDLSCSRNCYRYQKAEKLQQKLEKIKEHCTKYGQNSIGFRKKILKIIESEE